MRVAHVLTFISRTGAGVSASVEALSSAQVGCGADVRVYGVSDSLWENEDRQAWIGAPPFAAPSVGPLFLGYAPALARALREWDPDIVHVHGLWTWPMVAALSWSVRSGRPYIVSPHGMLSPVALSINPWRKRLARVLFQDRALASATRVLATSAQEEADVRSLGLSASIATIPNGVTVASRPKDLQLEHMRCVRSLGRLHYVKGLDMLIEAWAKLESRFPGWSLELVGPDEGNYSSELRSLIARLGLVHVYIREPIWGADRDRFMAGAEIFALPSRTENFALTVAESLMMEVPVVATKGAPWSGLESEDCGRWVDITPGAIAAGLEDLMLLTPEKRRAMGRRGRTWMLRDFTWQAIAVRCLGLYENAVLACGCSSKLDNGK